MLRIPVELGERSYDIVLGKQLLADLGSKMRHLGVAKDCLIVSNHTVFELYGQNTVASLEKEGFHPRVVLVEEGEGAKSLKWAEQLYNQSVEAKLERNSPIIALGGGVIGDLAGFIAATYMRGVPFIQVPTTLLAQVDSSVGGKVAINHPRGKNLIGAFYQPHLVVADLTTLHTLPMREIKAGMAEVIKYGVIWDGDFFAFLEREASQILSLDYEALQKIVATSCSIKARVVAIDEKESGLRAILNFGHTIGHALETLTDYHTYRHGEAVAIGTAVAAKMAVSRGLIEPNLAQRIIKLLQVYDLPIAIPEGITPENLVQCLLRDKKNKQGKIVFVLPDKLGNAKCHNFSSEEIFEYLRS